MLHHEQQAEILRKLWKTAQWDGDPSGSSFEFDKGSGHAVDGMTEETGLLAAGKYKISFVMINFDKEI